MVIVAWREKEEEKEEEKVEETAVAEEEEEATVLRKADTRGGWEQCRSMPASQARQPASQPTQPFRVYCSSVP